jgi:deazaflavin-dependent oxidoreductase (nitroreductase family)
MTNRVDSALYRRTGRSLASARADVVLLTTTGRRSGLSRTAPVSITEVDGCWLVGGGAGGITTDPDWVRNLRANERCRVQRGRTTHAMRARELAGDEYERAYERYIARYPYARRYARWAERHIPLVLLEEEH